MTGEEQLRILKMVQNGTISAADAERLLEALGPEATGPGASPTGEAILAQPGPLPHWERYPLVGGSLIVALAALLLALSYVSAPRGGSPVGAYVLLGFGLLFVLVGWWLARGTWLRIRIAHAQGGQPSFSFALPLPLGLAAWAVRLARPYVRQFDLTGVDELILALRDEARPGQLLSIDVAENEGERIQVSLG